VALIFGGLESRRCGPAQAAVLLVLHVLSLVRVVQCSQPTNTQRASSNTRETMVLQEEEYNHHNWQKGERFWVSDGHFRNFYPAYSGVIKDITTEGPIIKFENNRNIEQRTWKHFNKIGNRPTQNRPYLGTISHTKRVTYVYKRTGTQNVIRVEWPYTKNV